MFIRYSRYEEFKFINISLEVNDEMYLNVLEILFEKINSSESATLIIKDSFL